MVDISSYSSQPEESIRSESEAEGVEGEKIGWAPSVISRDVSSD